MRSLEGTHMSQPLLNAAITAARKAADIILRYWDRLDLITYTEKEKNDFVTQVDQLAEEEIIKFLKKSYPDHSILAEESGRHDGDDYLWLIDPLDGTTNFMHGIPHFCVSIALHHQGKPQIGVVYDPIRQELFTARRGSGAQLNQQRIRVSKQTSLSGAILGTGFPYRSDQSIQDYLLTLEALLPIALGLRRAGSAALDLAYVAAGRFDAFWEFGLKPWDIAAGALMVRESGGLLSDFNGGETFFEHGNIVAGNSKIFKELLQILQKSLKQKY